ncbi:hypothetical protein JW865_09550 [Candidatus Bathyarchaeota archaeon]|nr:hypothetical protein [Candidatus Bathyarchaeota archaeon]
MEKKTKYCPFCGNEIDSAYLNCPICGKSQYSVMEIKPKHKKKNMLLAVFLSLLFTGLGQAYLRQWFRGLAFIISAFSIVLFLGPYLTDEEIMIVGVFFGILSAIDAYFLAKKINQSSV